MSAQWYDANISILGCDKNMPGCIMAMGRLNRPSLMIYGGTIRAGHFEQQKLDIVSAFQSYGQFIAYSITDNQRQAIVRHSCPGAGACGGMYTTNTMASAIEALGMSLPYSSSTPADAPQKLEECYRAGGSGGWSDCSASEWRQDHNRCRSCSCRFLSKESASKYRFSRFKSHLSLSTKVREVSYWFEEVP